MNARKHRTNLNLSPLDFPAYDGIGKHSESTQTEPPAIDKNRVVLKITKAIIITDYYTNKEHEVLKAQSVYEIPVTELKTREDIYEFYKDAALILYEGYHYVKKQKSLPNLSFLDLPMDTYEKEIDGVLQLLNSRN